MLRQWIGGLQQWRQRQRSAAKFRRRQAWSQGLSVAETFDKIYAEGKWGRARNGAPFYSGDGSSAAMSRGYEDRVVDLISADASLGTWVDIGCGDFQVASRILARLDRPIGYTGVDVAGNVIGWHRDVHARPGVAFAQCNAVDEDPPRADLVTIRQVLQHLSNGEIARILERVRRLYRVAVITESLPVRFVAANLDIAHGIAVRIPLGSGVYIDEPPFGLSVAVAFDSPYSEKEFLRTSVVRLAA
ncbi:MAG: class I SAM-dependent methyltransferase [Hyphomicrobiaceae bacterium]|nr:class I SAM-dependent methyltransferase [Hyphomicrobiaceae bacterium]